MLEDITFHHVSPASHHKTQEDTLVTVLSQEWAWAENVSY